MEGIRGTTGNKEVPPGDYKVRLVSERTTPKGSRCMVWEILEGPYKGKQFKTHIR